MASAIGDITLDNGFAEALIIIGGQTIKGVGGGVCQVSTTLFRTAFFAGFPIVERYAHAYRVGYYEQRSNGSHDPSLAGLDATVYVPLVDFKFQNDTPYWLLMETYVNGYQPDLEVLLHLGRALGGLELQRPDQHRPRAGADLPREPRPETGRDQAGGLRRRGLGRSRQPHGHPGTAASTSPTPSTPITRPGRTSIEYGPGTEIPTSN